MNPAEVVVANPVLAANLVQAAVLQALNAAVASNLEADLVDKSFEIACVCLKSRLGHMQAAVFDLLLCNYKS
jgi:hypothetical protein